MATIHLVSPHAFEPWDWESPDTVGIGGSETMHSEIAWRLAARGHTVRSYVPLPPARLATLAAGERLWHRNVEWLSLAQADPTQPGLWILIRAMEWLDRFVYQDDQRIWCVLQDVDHHASWDEAWIPKVDRIIGLCTTHCAYLRQQHPTFADKIYQSRNGLRGDLVDATLDQAARGEWSAVRHPQRLLYASSPGRGLVGLLQAFKLMRFLVPQAELHVCYGFDNMEKLESACARWMIERIRTLAAQPGVVLRGRLGQPQLYREWVQAGLYVHPTNFTETGHISLLEAQALGAIPVVQPHWATGEYLLAGIGIEGDAEHDALTLRRYAMAAVYLMQHPELQEELRGPMMREARKRFDWEGVVDQYERWLREEYLA